MMPSGNTVGRVGGNRNKYLDAGAGERGTCGRIGASRDTNGNGKHSVAIRDTVIKIRCQRADPQ